MATAVLNKNTRESVRKLEKFLSSQKYLHEIPTGAFTTRQFAAKIGVGYDGAYSRIQRLVSTGVLRQQEIMFHSRKTMIYFPV